MSLLKRILLFPDSAYLRDRWWHRLANVAFWGWLAFTFLYYLNKLFLEPYDSCVKLMHQVRFNDPVSTFNCSDGIFAYTAKSYAGSELFILVVVAAMAYLTAIAPSLAYRLILYIASGMKWKDSNQHKAST